MPRGAEQHACRSCRWAVACAGGALPCPATQALLPLHPLQRRAGRAPGASRGPGQPCRLHAQLVSRLRGACRQPARRRAAKPPACARGPDPGPPQFAAHRHRPCPALACALAAAARCASAWARASAAPRSEARALSCTRAAPCLTRGAAWCVGVGRQRRVPVGLPRGTGPPMLRRGTACCPALLPRCSVALRHVAS